MPAEPRFLSFFPALPVERNLELGEWIVGKPPDGTPWVSERFRDLAETLVRSFETRGFRNGAFLWNRRRGFDGKRPSGRDGKAILAAVTFAALDASDGVTADFNKGRYVATTENADLFIQPIDEEAGVITHLRGGLLRRTQVGNLKIGGEPPPLGDAVEPISGLVRVSNKLAAAVFAMVRRTNRTGRSVAIAAEMHRSALANPFAVTIQQRLIALKTGFEALLRTTQSSRLCALRLRSLFESATHGYRDLLPWNGLLWSPNEKVRWRWEWMKDETRFLDGQSELERWFMALAKVRNDIIHKGVLPGTGFEAPSDRPLSRYAGNLFLTGERVLREAIKATLGPEILLCGAITKRAFGKAILENLREQIGTGGGIEKVGSAPAAETPNDPPTRTLSVLLQGLKCSAANLVTLSKLSGGASASLEVAIEMARRNANKWAAEAGPVSMVITAAERQLLKQAGAEDELADHWYPCE